jgi:hypothetical protein
LVLRGDVKMNKLNKYAPLCLFVLNLGIGCKLNEYEIREVDYVVGQNEYSVRLMQSEGYNRISICNNGGSENECLSGQDLDGDGRVDRLFLYAPLGSPLEDLASIGDLSDLLINLGE